MPTLAELKPHGCRYPLDERGQFCGVRRRRKQPHEREQSSYCRYHHGICYHGFGKDWSSLVEMVNAREHTVIERWQNNDSEAAVDEAICNPKQDKQVLTRQAAFWRKIHGRERV